MKFLLHRSTAQSANSLHEPVKQFVPNAAPTAGRTSIYFPLRRGSMHKRVWLAAFVCVLMLTAPVTAQTTNGSISGTVADSSGAAVAKAAITATNIRTGVALPSVTNDSGVYIFPSLLPGEYRVAAEMPGFRTAIAEHIQLEVGAEISVDLKLEVGAAAESVSVESTSSQLEAVNTSISNVVTLQRVQGLPLQS